MFISANGSLIEPYQIEILQKAVASDLSSTEEESIDKLLAKETKAKQDDTTGTVGNDSTDRKKVKP